MAQVQPQRQSTPESQPTHQASTNVKETIESILVAFILAFIFRAFVVEAFVIPTGSMAPTLDGAHMRYQCPDCGYVFDVNYAHGDGDDMNFPSEAYSPDDVYCPNCGYHIVDGPMHDREGYNIDVEGRRVQDPKFLGSTQPQVVHYGDRILVEKYAYLLTPPRRWDVVVFKAPDKPEEYHYTQNYIKRLVGEPGETLMVLDGDIYIKDEQGKWRIQQRPHFVQDALWRIIYDNDYYPQGLPRSDRAKPWTQPWTLRNGDGWQLGHSGADGRTFHFNGQSPATLAFNPDANAGEQTINDYLVYDIPVNQRRIDGTQLPNGDRQRFIVNDLKLAMFYQRGSGAGSLKLRLTKRDDAFTAEVTPDTVTLWHTHPDGTTSADAGPLKLADIGVQNSTGLWLEFSNVTYKVTLGINGKDVLTTTAQQYVPDMEQLRREYSGQRPAPNPPEITISAADQVSQISHVGLWRDIYYTNRDGALTYAIPSNPVHLHRKGEAREDREGTYDDDEYFVMGDNSLISGDARYWTEPIDLAYENLSLEAGRVPGRFVLGKAFFVYWPSGFRPVPGFPALIPNFGDMRFIH